MRAADRLGAMSHQVSLALLLGLVVCGTACPEHVRENAGAAEGHLTEDVLRKLNAAT